MCVSQHIGIMQQVVFSSITTGARDDLEKVTNMAYDIVMRYGMRKKVKSIIIFCRKYLQRVGYLHNETVPSMFVAVIFRRFR